MKITLHRPLEGFEAEAIAFLEQVPDAAKREVRATIILTPKKRKYWRLDPVATFEEATQFYEDCSARLGKFENETPRYHGDYGQKTIQWLKLTEHTE